MEFKINGKGNNDGKENNDPCIPYNLYEELFLIYQKRIEVFANVYLHAFLLQSVVF